MQYLHTENTELIRSGDQGGSSPLAPSEIYGQRLKSVVVDKMNLRTIWKGVILPIKSSWTIFPYLIKIIAMSALCKCLACLPATRRRLYWRGEVGEKQRGRRANDILQETKQDLREYTITKGYIILVSPWIVTIMGYIGNMQ